MFARIVRPQRSAPGAALLEAQADVTTGNVYNQPHHVILFFHISSGFSTSVQGAFYFFASVQGFKDGSVTAGQNIVILNL